jgi:O-acetyl-ADP-ribose deacetylase (regulator of RNase III)
MIGIKHRNGHRHGRNPVLPNHPTEIRPVIVVDERIRRRCGCRHRDLELIDVNFRRSKSSGCDGFRGDVVASGDGRASATSAPSVSEIGRTTSPRHDEIFLARGESLDLTSTKDYLSRRETERKRPVTVPVIFTVGGRLLEVRLADITTLDVDVIVNAANPTLLGGGGVDGAIHRAAGPGLVEECRGLGGCPTGEARITGGHRLPAARVIHTVGPIWADGTQGEPALLAAAYRSSIALVAAEGLKSVAFPAISTGVYGFPPELAAPIAVSTVIEATAGMAGLHVIFCCFSERSADLHVRVLEARTGTTWRS